VNQQEESYRRILFILGMFFIILIILAGQLVKIQIGEHFQLSVSANEQRRSVLLHNKLRGVFLDHDGRILRGAKDNWYLVIRNASLNPRELTKLDFILGPQFPEKFSRTPPVPFWIYPEPLTDWQINQIDQLNIKGLRIVANILNYDQSNTLAWHLLGFVQRGQGFSGLEYLYDPVFENQQSDMTVFTVNDGLHRYIPGLGLRAKNKPGNTAIVLTLERRIQQLVEKVMDREHLTGAVLILNAGTGHILAMTSRPVVNCNNLSESITSSDYPFLNRAISAYHPGSIFKLVILAAGLDSGQLNSTDTFFDPGYFEAGDRKWYCTTSDPSGHGLITLSEALAYSCNPVFIQIALKLKPALILQYADNFGLGQPCNIGLRDESWGEIPSGLDFLVGDQVNIALGEGNIYTTPLQIASLVQTIANDGIRRVPQLVSGYMTRGNKFRWLEQNPPVRVIQVETARVIQEMMAGVIAFGTGKEAQTSGGAAGKTGTAQSGPAESWIEHAWFAGYAPLKNPRYVAVVFCEKGISGGKTAAPIFKEIMEQLILF
jgi:cell division protein FtsI/penicillin-binding protein 2